MNLEEIARAQTKASSLARYWATILYGWEIVITPDCPTLAVDNKMRLYVNPSFLSAPVAGQTPADVAAHRCFALLHEAWHVVFRHHARAKAAGIQPTPDDSLLWNLAADMEVNSGLQSMLPTVISASPSIRTDYIFPDKAPYHFAPCLTAEEYLSLLRQNPPPAPPKQGQGGQGSGNGQSNGQGQGASPPGGKPQPGKGNGGCGSAAGPGQYPWERTAGDKADAAGKKGKSEFEQRSLAKVAAEKMAAAQKSGGKAQGSGAGLLDRLIDSIFGEPKVDWRQALRNVIARTVESAAGYEDTTYRRPFMLGGALSSDMALPAWESRPVRVGILIDTSGSMGDTDLREALEETVGILRTVDGRVRVASADYDLSEQSIVEDIRAAPDVKLIGGGGTDMGAALIRLAGIPWQDGASDDAVILFTDGMTPWCDAPPSKAAYVVVIVGGYPTTGVPDWATTLTTHGGK